MHDGEILLSGGEEEIREIERLITMVSEFCLEPGLSSDVRDDVNLALDEVVANVILHGLKDAAEHHIIVRLSLEPGCVTVGVEDEGWRSIRWKFQRST